MTSTTKLSCTINTTNAESALALEIWLDDQQIFVENHVSQTILFEHELEDNDGEHELKFVMTNKKAEHTKIDQSGAILSDARLVITDIAFDEICLGQMFTDLATYSHDFNGTGQPTQEKFYSEMGCNGTVALKFTTPVYLWLLENL